MSEDWSSIAAEVADAIRSVSDISQPNGYPVTLRIPGETTGPEWDPQPGVPVYRTLYAVEDYQEVKDQTGTLIGVTVHRLLVTAEDGVVPQKSQQVAIGIAAEDASESSPWIEIVSVVPTTQSGIDLCYTLNLAG